MCLELGLRISYSCCHTLCLAGAISTFCVRLNPGLSNVREDDLMVKRQMKRGNCGQCVRTAPVCTGFEDAQPCLNPAYCSLSKALRRRSFVLSQNLLRNR